MKQQFRNIKDSYQKTSFILGFHKGLGSSSKDINQKPQLMYGVENQLQSETKEQFPLYDLDLYKD